ncbi:hypothetical protein Bca4012_055157 [Brassica carinata]
MSQANATAKALRYIDDEEEDDQDVCRICRTPGDTDNPLQYPCACSGSIKFVHQDCLLQWLDYRKAHRCEVCKHRFSFSPLYDEKAPRRLPLNEFVVGIAMKVWRCRVLHASLRLSFLLLVWLLTLPFITFWTWRLAFVRSFGEAKRLLFLSHVSTTVVLTDCLLGFLLSATIIFILLEAASLGNFVRQLRRNFLFDELVPIQSPLFLLVKFAFTILASNMICLGVVIFVPFTLGRVILYQVAADLLKGFVAGPSKLYDVTTLTVGYMFLVLLYLVIIKRQPLNFGRLYGVASIAGSTVDQKRSLLLAGNVEQSHSEYMFVLRVVLLLLSAWVTLLLFNTAMIVVPVSLGRALFNAIPTLPITHGIKCNDLYAFVIGTYVLWTTLSGAWYAIEHIKSRSALRNQIWRWCGIVFKSSVLLAIWIFIIPVLIGLVFELLVIVPMRVPVDETPFFLLYQDWALGLIFLKIWTTLIILLDDTWKAKFERVEVDGFSRLQGLWVLKEIVSPIVMKLLTALCVPYVLARGVFPMLGYPLTVNSTVYRFAWIGCLSASLLCFCAKKCHDWFIDLLGASIFSLVGDSIRRLHVWFGNLHNSIRDDRYLIGRRLHNFDEAALAKRIPKR